MSRDKKEIKEAINQLESLRLHNAEMRELARSYGPCMVLEDDSKALDIAIEVLKRELQITRENVEVINVKATSKLPCIKWWDEKTKNQVRTFVKRQAIEQLKIELLKQDIIKIQYDYPENTLNIKAIASLDIVKREV